jgi:hypothetical protein
MNIMPCPAGNASLRGGCRPSLGWQSMFTCMRGLAAFQYAPLSMIVPITCRSMDASFCVQTLEDAIAKYRKPEIINTDSHIMVTSSGQPIHRRRLDYDFDQG